MRKLLALLTAIVLCVVVFCPPALAVYPDPSDPPPAESAGDSESDDTGWGVPDPKNGSAEPGGWDVLEWSVLSYLYSIIVVEFVDYEQPPDAGDSRNQEEAGGR